MREPRIYTQQPLTVGSNITLSAAATHHLRLVLRLREGAIIKLFNGDGREYIGNLLEVSTSNSLVQVTALSSQEPEPPIKLHLLLGLSKGERMDLVMQKASELGVTHLTPLIIQRNVVQIRGERIGRRHAHWQQVITSACEQSGRCRLPKLDLPLCLEAALAETAEDCRLVLHHLGATTLRTTTPPTQGIAIIVGPEGGLESKELQQTQQFGFIPVCLGPRILRTETAPLAALAAVQTLWGDFS